MQPSRFPSICLAPLISNSLFFYHPADAGGHVLNISGEIPRNPSICEITRRARRPGRGTLKFSRPRGRRAPRGKFRFALRRTCTARSTAESFITRETRGGDPASAASRHCLNKFAENRSFFRLPSREPAFDAEAGISAASRCHETSVEFSGMDSDAECRPAANRSPVRLPRRLDFFMGRWTLSGRAGGMAR